MTRKRKPAALMHAADHYQAALEAVASGLGAEPDSELAKHVAFLRLVRDNMTAAAIRGERVVVADVLALDQALKGHLPEREQLKIDVSFVEGAVGIGFATCPECGHRAQHHFGEGTLDPLPPKPAPVEVPAVVEAAPSTAPTKDNVVELGSRLHYGSEGSGFMGGFARSGDSGVGGLAFNDLNPNRGR
jgi:hypothetical protein